jgi:16S rRNA (cytosine1402-N4)-methyltransferase
MKHITVLKSEAVDSLDLKSNSVVVDCTFGSGGHAREIISKLGSSGVYVGVDADETAFSEHRTEIEASLPITHLVTANFSQIDTVLDDLNLASVDAILADLGWRTEQFTDSSKGFSFSDDSVPLMTYGDPHKYTFTAYDIVNDWEEVNIADIIFAYGEEKGSRLIAKAIVEYREEKPIKSSKELAEIICDALPDFVSKRKIHPATKTFQALRIAVNDEFKVVEELIAKGFARLSSGGRMSIITFHSLEDRRVKNLFRDLTHDHKAKKLTKKPVTPNDQEIKNNPRARSAKLRTIVKI